MTPNEVIEKLNKLYGITVSRKTLYNWEKWGLIPEPTFRNSRVTEYPEDIVFEAFAAYYLLHGGLEKDFMFMKPNTVCEARKRALAYINGERNLDELDVQIYARILVLAYEWIWHRTYAEFASNSKTCMSVYISNQENIPSVIIIDPYKDVDCDPDKIVVWKYGKATVAHDSKNKS